MREAETNMSEISGDTQVAIFAVLEDLSGKKCYLRTFQGSYIWQDSDRDNFRVATEAEAYTATVKHDYKIVNKPQPFSFGERDKFLFS